MESPAPWTPPSPAPSRFEALGLVLREYENEDAPALFEAVDTSRASLLPWLPFAKTQYQSVEAAAELIALFTRARRDLLHPELGAVFGAVNGVFDAATGELLGGTGVNRISAPRHNGEIGYWVRSSRQRQGVATRAAAAMLSWCFLPQTQGGYGLRRVHIFAAQPNVASVGVPTRLGLHRYGQMRKDRFEDGYGWVDTVAWDVLADEWDTEQ
ncbi:MAG: GNAT family N-acetyltransferase, partial [Phycisphaerales bacterium]